MKTPAQSLRDQVNRILHAKVLTIARHEYAKANPQPGRKHKPYTLPSCAHDMVAMLGRIETATADELEAMAHYATTGEVFERATK